MRYLAYLYFVCLIVFSLFIFSNWTFMLIVWIGLVVLLQKKAKLLPSALYKLFHIVTFAYPLMASVIKYMIENNVIAYSWFWLNRFEHFFWAFSMTIILLPLVYQYQKVIAKKWLLFVLGCVTITLGNVIEIIEFSLRQNLTDTRLGLYYADTMLDILMNFTGVIVALIVGFLLFGKKTLKQD